MLVGAGWEEGEAFDHLKAEWPETADRYMTSRADVLVEEIGVHLALDLPGSTCFPGSDEDEQC